MFTPGALPGAGAPPFHLRFGVSCRCRPHAGHINVRLPRLMSNALIEPAQSAKVFGAVKEVLDGLLSELPNLGLSNAKSMA